MAPLFQAVKVEYAGISNDQKEIIFKGSTDPDWVLNGVVHGGCVLAQVLEALVAYQLRVHPEHPDPFHLSAHYLSRSQVGPCEIRVKGLKHGRTFTNLTAELTQQGNVTLVAQSIFGSMTLSRDNQMGMKIEPPSPFARRLPIYHHPSQPTYRDFLQKSETCEVSEDMDIYDRNKPEKREQLFEQVKDGPDGQLQKLAGGGIECGRWVTLKGEESDHIRPSLIACFADMQLGFPTLLSDQPHHSPGWQATLALNIQFFVPIPKPGSSHHATRTVGVYGRSNFLAAPYDRHDGYAEVWTAPTNIGEGEVEEGWRENQVCLASATQMAVVIPMALNLKQSKTKL